MDYDREKVDEFISWAEDISKTLVVEEAFCAISKEIDNCEDRYLNDYLTALNFIKYEKVLDWIEQNASRTINVGANWGHLAASSKFNWARAEKWLALGRPLSLIALDGVMFCTTKGQRLNQSLFMRELNPTLPDNPGAAVIARRLTEYLNFDKAPRVRFVTQKIIHDIFEL